MEPLQKLPRRRRLGRLIAQAPFQAGIVGQEPQVFRTLPSCDLEQDQRLDDPGFGESALALAQGQVGFDQAGQAQRPEGAGDREQPGVGAGRLGQRPGIQDKRCFGQQGQARRHAMTYRKSICKSQLKSAFSPDIFQSAENKARIRVTP